MGMEDFPASHTTAAAPVGEPEKKIYVNSAYLKTKYGKLKIAHLVICIIVFICTMLSNSPRSNPANWLSFVAMGGFWASGGLLFLFVINLVSFLAIIPWLKLELVYTILWTFFWFVSGCVASSNTINVAGADAFAAAAFFAFVAMCIYGFNAFLFFKEWRENANNSSFIPQTTTAAPKASSTTVPGSNEKY
ncbi:CKLF-like MARVEL transmembrane domain-containing protein 4 isoform X1 [Penaeus japonicus]|uniref:CKLF-like MARVEL transmembrane domain-containing protein 4 isoform X1 n=2 Tax=Penaeus japonicus TaxID=27405 RepID=UPI001C70E0FF|nr:CKLF-like MARVEL transmembrane domain-containing protein 4 isoform X1 [Penaeus japonicus]